MKTGSLMCGQTAGLLHEIRPLRAILEEVMTRIMYDIPSDPTIAKAVITRECVDGTGRPVLTKDPEKVSYSVKLNPGKSGKSRPPKSAS